MAQSHNLNMGLCLALGSLVPHRGVGFGFLRKRLSGDARAEGDRVERSCR